MQRRAVGQLRAQGPADPVPGGRLVAAADPPGGVRVGHRSVVGDMDDDPRAAREPAVVGLVELRRCVVRGPRRPPPRRTTAPPGRPAIRSTPDRGAGTAGRRRWWRTICVPLPPRSRHHAPRRASGAGWSAAVPSALSARSRPRALPDRSQGIGEPDHRRPVGDAPESVQRPSPPVDLPDVAPERREPPDQDQDDRVAQQGQGPLPRAAAARPARSSRTGSTRRSPPPRRRAGTC